MCGIVGYIGARRATQIIIDGLKRLEYRGYDSAGIATLDHQNIHIRRDIGKLSNLKHKLTHYPIDGNIGIGHTRWATHGIPSEHNAHPHISMNGDFVIVHNGIVENYLELKQMLQAQGITFQSDTDSEVIAQLIEYQAKCNPKIDLTEATRQAIQQLRGSHALVAMSKSQPYTLVAVKIGHAGGVVIGIGDGEYYIASDVPAIIDYTSDMIFLDSHQIVTLTATSCDIQRLDGTPIRPDIQHVDWHPEAIAKGEYPHYMLKEIFEQPQSIANTLSGRIDFDHHQVNLSDLHLTPDQAQSLERMVTIACGTSYYSALVGKFYIEQFAQLHVEVDYGSEYRYRDPILNEHTAVLAITQSGETVDTLSAMESAHQKNAIVWSIVNNIGSQAMRLANGFIHMNAGSEIGVASTKAFTTSIVDQLLLALYLGQLRGTIHPTTQQQMTRDIARLPAWIGQVLAKSDSICNLAQQFCGVQDFLFIGRGINYPIALEGALKLKEISYIHAEGYPAGEMKHGPIALIDEQMPVLAIALQDSLYEKMISQIEQVKARGGIVIALATEGDTLIATKADYVIYLPDVPELLSPIVSVVPLQLLAYHIAVLRGADVDQPRNLAKSVTVE